MNTIEQELRREQADMLKELTNSFIAAQLNFNVASRLLADLKASIEISKTAEVAPAVEILDLTPIEKTDAREGGGLSNEPLINEQRRAFHQLMRHEGFRPNPYLCTSGVWTIGYGFTSSEHLAMAPMNVEVATEILNVLYSELESDLSKRLMRWDCLTPARKGVLINMAYNLGIEGLFKFERMLASMRAFHYELAGREMLRSKWAGQVGLRARELATIMRDGDTRSILDDDGNRICKKRDLLKLPRG